MKFVKRGILMDHAEVVSAQNDSKVVYLTTEQIIDIGRREGVDEVTLNNVVAWELDGSIIEHVMMQIGEKTPFLDNKVHVFNDGKGVVFADKDFIMEAITADPKRVQALMNDMAYRYVSRGVEFYVDEIKTADLPPLLFSGIDGYTEKLKYETLEDARDSEYLEYFYPSVTVPVLKAVNEQLKGVEGDKWIYLATADFVINQIGDSKEYAAVKEAAIEVVTPIAIQYKAFCDEAIDEFKRILNDHAGRLDSWLESDLTELVECGDAISVITNFLNDYYESSLSYLGFNPEIAKRFMSPDEVLLPAVSDFGVEQDTNTPIFKRG